MVKITRRRFAAMLGTACMASAGAVSGLLGKQATAGRALAASAHSSDSSSPTEPPSISLPAPAPNHQTAFGIDLNINMSTIDRYLGRSNCAYIDLRMLRDPGDYASIGGSPNLDVAIEGFRIVPFPYLATLPQMTIEGCYAGDTLFNVEWGADNRSVVSVEARYVESEQILRELFPQDKNLLLMCGGSGYAGMTRILLKHLGWDPERLYNVGGGWDYTGSRGVRLVEYSPTGRPTFCFWRANYATIDFSSLTLVGSAAAAGALDVTSENGVTITAEQIAAMRAAQLGGETADDALSHGGRACAVR